MAAQLTQLERTRVYVAFKACPTCGAHRGEMCFKLSRLGVRIPYRQGYHWTRGPYTRRYPLDDNWEKEKARYQKLRQQILDQREVIGHE